MKKRTLITGIIFLIIFLIIALFNSMGSLDCLNDFVYSSIIHLQTPTMTIIMRIITRLGSRILLASFCILLLIFPKVVIKDKVTILMAVGGAAIISIISKYIFLIERPNILRLVEATGYSFPSNHSTAAMALYTIFLLLILDRAKSTKAKTIAKCFFIIPVLVGLSRIYLGVHYFSDVIAGWSLGIGVSLIVYYISKDTCKLKES